MPALIEIITPRLRLRQWRESDRAPYASLNADPAVMRYFAGTQSREDSDRSIDVWRRELDERGWSNWAVEVLASGTFAGFIGLSVPRRALPFMPCVEVGYRLSKAHWGKGYATEGAQAALKVAFTQLALDEVVSFTARLNLPSRAVMQRIGMSDTNEDFDHPALPKGSELRRHCLYRITRAAWVAMLPGSAIEAGSNDRSPGVVTGEGHHDGDGSGASTSGSFPNER
jgi:RimJ/RimL family protein N-acetyltransferase